MQAGLATHLKRHRMPGGTGLMEGTAGPLLIRPDRSSATPDTSWDLRLHYRSAAEPSGAVAFARLVQAADRLPDGPVGVVLSGGNVDWPTYRRLLDDAMEPTERNFHAAPVLR